MIVTEGGWSAGMGCTSLKASRSSHTICFGSCFLAGPASSRCSSGKHTIVFDFKYDGPGVAKGGSGVLKVDGQTVASLAIPHTIPFLIPADETFDVGVDTRTGVNDQDYKCRSALKARSKG